MTTLKAVASRQGLRFKKWMFTPKTFAGGLGRLFIGLTILSLPVSMLQSLTGCDSEEAAKQPAVEQVQPAPSPVATPSPLPSPMASPPPEQAEVEEPTAPQAQEFREPDPEPELNPEPIDEPEPPPATPSVRTSGNCSSFASHAEAQASLEAGNSKLDRDKDGIACESLL